MDGMDLTRFFRMVVVSVELEKLRINRVHYRVPNKMFRPPV